MYAIFENGNKQYRVSVGDVVKVEKLNAQVGATVTFPVVMCADEGGVQVGGEVAGKTVCGEVVEQGQEDNSLQVQSQEERKEEAGSQTALHQGQDNFHRRSRRRSQEACTRKESCPQGRRGFSRGSRII